MLHSCANAGIEDAYALWNGSAVRSLRAPSSVNTRGCFSERVNNVVLNGEKQSNKKPDSNVGVETRTKMDSDDDTAL